MGWKTRLLVNRTNLRMGSNGKITKRKGFVLKKIILNRIQEGMFLYIILKFGYKFSSRMLQCFFLFSRSPFLFPLPPFILSLPLIPTFRMHARWLVLILVPSAPPTSLHVVAVRLKYTVQLSLPH